MSKESFPFPWVIGLTPFLKGFCVDISVFVCKLDFALQNLPPQSNFGEPKQTLQSDSQGYKNQCMLLATALLIFGTSWYKVKSLGASPDL